MAGRTVLVIEDDALQREALGAELDQQGFAVVTAEQGKDALKLLSDHFAPDLILLDMLNPRGQYDGWWFLGHRQRNPALASIPVVIMTSLSVASVEWAVSLGAAGLIRKPFEADSLLAEIRRCIGDKDQGCPLRHQPDSPP